MDSQGTQSTRRRNKATTALPSGEERIVEDVTDKPDSPRRPSATRAAGRRDAGEEEPYSPWLDLVRVLTFLLAASCGLSYLVSGGESLVWGVRHTPKYLSVDWWKAQFRGPVYLTLDELKSYDGSDETKPIYLAINGSIYDVSANPGTYGPGGSYNVFAGADSSRGFVTGCFKDDRTADMRGVEEMYIPADDPELDRRFTAAELAEVKAQEREAARKRVHEGLSHWVQFFANNPRYPHVGYVKREANWLEKEPRKKLCAQALKGRPKRRLPKRG